MTGKDEVRQHLAELGFVMDSEVTVVSEVAGNLILQVKDSRIALDQHDGKPDHGLMSRLWAGKEDSL